MFFLLSGIFLIAYSCIFQAAASRKTESFSRDRFAQISIAQGIEKASFDIQGDDEKTALFFNAAAGGQLSQMLTAIESNKSILDKECQKTGKTGLFFALENGHYSATNLLLGCKADPFKIDRQQKNLLMYILKSTHQSSLDSLMTLLSWMPEGFQKERYKKDALIYSKIIQNDGQALLAKKIALLSGDKN